MTCGAQKRDRPLAGVHNSLFPYLQYYLSHFLFLFISNKVVYTCSFS